MENANSLLIPGKHKVEPWSPNWEQATLNITERLLVLHCKSRELCPCRAAQRSTDLAKETGLCVACPLLEQFMISSWSGEKEPGGLWSPHPVPLTLQGPPERPHPPGSLLHACRCWKAGHEHLQPLFLLFPADFAHLCRRKTLPTSSLLLIYEFPGRKDIFKRFTPKGICTCLEMPVITKC